MKLLNRAGLLMASKRIRNSKAALLGVILLAAFFLRVVDITGNPPALYGDELTLSLDANSLLQTAHDQTGAFLPLYFKMSDGRPPAYVYFSVPFVALFGPDELGVRALSILSGVWIVALTFLLTRQMLGEEVAFFAAGLMALSPWDIAMSRGGFESHFGLFLTMLGIWALLGSVKKPWLMIVSALGFGLAVHTYHSYKPLVFLILPALIWFIGTKNSFSGKFRKYLFSSTAIFVFLIGVWIWQIFAGSEIRLQDTNILGQKDLQTKIVQDINIQRSASSLPIPVAVLFHNKFLSNALLIGENYFDNFFPDFLFLHGDGNPRQNPATMGELYFVQLILIFFGGYYIFIRDRRLFILLIFLLAVAPLPAAVVADAHALRSAFLLPTLTILSGAGLYFLWMIAKRNIRMKAVLWGLVSLLLLQFLFFTERTYFLAPNLYGQFWSVPAKQASLLAEKSKNNFSYVVISNQIDNIQYAYPVYAEVFPGDVQDQNKNPYLTNGMVFRKYGNVLIGSMGEQNLQQSLKNLPGSLLYIGAPKDLQQLPSADITYDKEGLPMFISFKKNN